MHIRRGAAIWIGVVVACGSAAGMRAVDSSQSGKSPAVMAESTLPNPNMDSRMVAPYQGTSALTIAQTMAARR